MSAKQVVLKAAERVGLAALARRLTASHLRILCYHGLWVTPGYRFGNHLFMPPEQFEARMRRLRASGCPVLGLGEAVERLAADDLPPRATVITIDDGWASTHTHMLPVLESLDLPATLYATTWYAARDLPVVNIAVGYLLEASGRSDLARQPLIRRIEALPEENRGEAVRALGRDLGVDEAWLETRQFHLMQAPELADAHRRGLDVQLHTHRHIDVSQRVDRLGQEVRENRDFLAATLGTAPAHFCYPSGTFHRDAPAVLAANGVRSATLVDEGLNAPGADRFRLHRFVDGRRVSAVEFDAYLSGTLHLLTGVRSLLRSKGGVGAPRVANVSSAASTGARP